MTHATTTGGAKTAGPQRLQCARCHGRLFDDDHGLVCIACGGVREPRESASAFILAGGKGTRLGALTRTRPKPALPFGGDHRLIDFTLANCAYSNIADVTVLTQHGWQAVHRALLETDGPGRPPRIRPLPLLTDDSGTAGAVRAGLARVRVGRTEHLLVLAADHVYRMDYRPLLDAHIARSADVTLSVCAVALDDAERYGIVDCDPEGRVRSFVEKPRRPRSTLASMGVYVFSARALDRLLELDAKAPESSHDLGRDIVPLALRLGLSVQAFNFVGYWRDVGTVDGYWQATQDLLDGGVPTAHEDWPLPHRAEFDGEPKVEGSAVVEQSVLRGPCRIAGTVRRSVISPHATVEAGAVVVASVLLPGARVARGAFVRRAIVDERAVVTASARIEGVAGAIAVVPADTRVPTGPIVADQSDRRRSVS